MHNRLTTGKESSPRASPSETPPVEMPPANESHFEFGSLKLDDQALQSCFPEPTKELTQQRTMDSQQLNDLLRPMLLPDLRKECRARGLNPGGGREALLDRVREDMLQTGNFVLTGNTSGSNSGAVASSNNYSRPEGQNVGNFLTDRNSSRVLRPPGGASQISFGGDDEKPTPVKTKFETTQLSGDHSATSNKHVTVPASPGGVSVDNSPKIAAHSKNNNYHRSEGQNVGNFLTDRNSSRVIAPPGGHSNITFG